MKGILMVLAEVYTSLLSHMNVNKQLINRVIG